MRYFVSKGSIVRSIWGNGDVILLIFAGASAEFALNKAVDWLYYTGRLPSDPLGRLFSTVAYAREIVFSEYDHALRAIDKISSIHKAIENQRGRDIPDWAYRDVLYMLIDYSIRSYELLERNLSLKEKEEVYVVFLRVGLRMNLRDLPQNYQEWSKFREISLEEDLINSHFTRDLYNQYRKHLGWFRFLILKQSQTLLVPKRVNILLGLGESSCARVTLTSYKCSRYMRLQQWLRNMLLPTAYKAQIIALDNTFEPIPKYHRLRSFEKHCPMAHKP